MIYKCITCNGALEYDAALDKMKCQYCGNVYEISEMDLNTKQEAYVQENVSLHSEETMLCKIYCCTACSAEILVDEVEAATFCAYCGQPTVVFDRVSGELRPKYIVPFRIDKKQAMNIIRKRIENSQFAPKQIKEYSVEKIRGIYIPYRLYDIDYYDNQVWESESTRDKLSKKKVYEREARYTFKDLPIDTSSRLYELITQRVEPFDLRHKKTFEPEYLSGYYADKCDMIETEIEQVAGERAKELFDRTVMKTFDDPSAKLTYSKAKTEILRSEYALLPAWFMTFRYNDEPYTFIVNGQTGKIVGSLPIQKSKVILLFILISLVTCSLSILFLWMIVSIFSGVEILRGLIVGALAWIAIFATIPYFISFVEYQSMQMVHTHAKSQDVVKFVRERQDKE